MGATVVLGISDPHWHSRRPSKRRDHDWMGTQRRKIQDLLTVAQKIKVNGTVGASAIQIAGDLFHVPEAERISRSLDMMLITELKKSPCPILTIPGNHDMQAERLESLNRHPYGILCNTNIITDVSWPNYLLVGEDPQVIVTGYPYTPDGPAAWLNMLTTSRDLTRLKDQLSQKSGKRVWASVMTHNHWGEQHGYDAKHIHRTGKYLLLGTGIDVCHYGDPHTFDGVEWLEDGTHRTALVGPGAFIRGTLAEHDINRQPCFSVFRFFDDRCEIEMVPIPHEPSDQVFNLERHVAEKKRAEYQSKFMDTIHHLHEKTTDQSVASMIELASNQDGIRPGVLALVDKYLRQVDDTE